MGRLYANIKFPYTEGEPPKISGIHRKSQIYSLNLILSSQNNLAPEQSQLPWLSAAPISVASLQPTEAEPAKVTSPGKVRIELTQFPIWIP